MAACSFSPFSKEFFICCRSLSPRSEGRCPIMQCCSCEGYYPLWFIFLWSYLLSIYFSTSNVLSMESQLIEFVIGGSDHAVCRYSVIKYLWSISSFCACCQEYVIWAKVQTLLDVNLTRRIILGTNRSIYFQNSNCSFMWPCYRYLIKKSLLHMICLCYKYLIKKILFQRILDFVTVWFILTVV